NKEQVTEPEAPTRRVLPDLLAAAREKERESITQPTRKRSAPNTLPGQRRYKADHRVAVPSKVCEADQMEPPDSVRSGPAEAAIALSHRKPASSKIPPGQRWKERRLPRVCWACKPSRS